MSRDLDTSLGRGGFRADINLLRALAVTAVVLFHFQVPGFKGGAIGVDIFFVISGFLMTKLIAQSPADLFGFFAFIRARLARIVPALAAMVLACFALAPLLIDPLQQGALFKEGTYAISFLSNFYYWKTINYFSGVGETHWLLHTWSLSVEWQFYVGYPVALILARRWWGKTGAKVMVYLIAGFSLTLLMAPPESYRFYLLPFRAWEMATGGLAFHHAIKSSRKLLAIGGYALVIGSVIFIDPANLWPSWWTLVPVLGTAIVLATNVDVSRLPTTKLLNPIGLWSYSIYLWHWPLTVYLHYAWREISVPLTVVGLVGSVLLGWLSYGLIEVPSKSLLRKKSLTQSLGFFAMACALVVAVIPVQTFSLSHLNTISGTDTTAWRNLASAPADGPASPGACNRMDAKGAVVPCIIEGQDRGGKSVLVLGDSHAEMWMPRLNKLAQTPGNGLGKITLVFSDGCPVLVGLEAGGRHCVQLFEAAQRLAQQSHFNSIVILSDWSFYRDIDPALCLLEVSACRKLDGEEAASKGFANLDRNIAALAATGARVTLVMPPVISVPVVPVEASWRLFFHKPLDGLTPLLRSEQDKKRQTAVMAFRAIAQHVPIDLLDPFDLLCDAQACNVLAADHSTIFRDSEHLRASFTAQSGFLDQAILR